MKRKVVIHASRQDARNNLVAKQEARDIYNKLKQAFDAIESCSQEAFVKYVPESIHEELNLAIREMSDNFAD